MDSPQVETGDMDLTKLAIHRPLAVTVGFLVAVLIGIFSLIRLPIDLMPDITYPTLTVRTDYAGVGPEEVETLVTRPIEETVAAIQGLEEITSTSVEGRSQVRLRFQWGTNLDVATSDVSARIDRVRNRLPEDVSPPNILKFDLAAFPVVFLAVSGDLSPLELKRLAEDQVKPRLERLPGVATVDLRGGLDREIRVELDRHRLAAFALTTEQVRQALSRDNLNVAAGEYREGTADRGLRIKGEFTRMEEIADTTVTVRNGTPVRVRDVGTVIDGYQDVQSSVTINGVPSLMVAINKQSGSNTVQVADQIRREIQVLNQELRGANVTITNDTSRFIRRSIEHISQDLVVGAILAILVLLFFLREVTSTLIVATAIPVSVITTFALLYWQNFSLNTMSLGGLALGIGRLVDDSIVVIENIFRHRAMGKSPREAALDGTRQVSLAIIASTAATLAVFVPLIFLSGMTGVMFQQLSLVVVFALSCSLVVAQGLIPLLVTQFMPEQAPAHRPQWQRLYDRIDRWLSGLERSYAQSLEWALGHAKPFMAAVALLVLISLALWPMIPSEFMPSADEGEVRIQAEMAPGTALDVLESRFRQLEAIAQREVPEAKTLIAEIGGGGWRASGTHTGSLRLILADARHRHRSSEEIANALRPAVSGLAGLSCRVSAGGSMPIMRMGQQQSDGRMAVEIRGYDVATSKRLLRQVQDSMEQVDGLTDVRASREAGRPETVITVDRVRSAQLGLSVSQVAEAIQTGTRGSRATYFREGGDEFAVLVRLKESQRQSLPHVLETPVRSANGSLIPLREVVRLTTGEGPSQIERRDQERVITVSAETTTADLGGLAQRLRQRLQNIPVPNGFSLVVTGDFEKQQEAFKELVTILGLAVLLVFLVMVAQFESVRYPFVIFLSVPSSITGVVAALLLTRTTLNVQSFIGIVVLVGVAVSNGIVMVDFMIKLLHEQKRPLEEAVREGAKARLRPVLMTTLTTILAMVPMALGLGEGSELQSPMARVVIGGLLTSTVITLYVVPLVFRWINRLQASKASSTCR